MSTNTESRRLCFSCVGEAFLRAEIEKNGHDEMCSYCGSEGATFSIGEIANLVETAFEEHFYCTPTEPSGMEYMAMKEGELDWERQGDPVADIISQYAEIGPEPAEDIRSVLSDRHSDWELMKMGEEQPFEKDARYAESGVDCSDSQAGWLHFEQILKREARYFSKVAEETLTSIFEGIAEHETLYGNPIILEAGPETKLTEIYRARVFQTDKKLEEALKRPDKEIGPPPALIATNGRMNAHGIAVFYGATDPRDALAEVRPPVGSRSRDWTL